VHVIHHDIRGSLQTPPRSSHPANILDVSTRAARQDEATDRFSPTFWPAIDLCATDIPGVRKPSWYAVKFDATRTRLIELLMDMIGLDYRIFIYHHQRARRRPTIRSWLPGYFFASFDANRDGWYQIPKIPGVIEILGAPTPMPDGALEDLAERCPTHVRPAGDELESIPRGAIVRVLRGSFAGDDIKTVTWSQRKRVKVLVMAFNRPMEVELRTKDVEVVNG
jgi:transcription antitermination factor NusG